MGSVDRRQSSFDGPVDAALYSPNLSTWDTPPPDVMESPETSLPTTPAYNKDNPLEIDSFSVARKSRTQVCFFVIPASSLRKYLITVTQRRREQNRAAQRAFRSRREDKMKELESEIERLKRDANLQDRCSGRIKELSEEILRLQGIVKDRDQRIAALVFENKAATEFAQAMTSSPRKVPSTSCPVSVDRRNKGPPSTLGSCTWSEDEMGPCSY